MLYHPEYFLSDAKPGMDRIRRSLRKVVFLGTPTNFDNILEERASVFKFYYGTIENGQRYDLTHMLADLSDDQARRLPPTLDMVSQKDPDEILGANEKFAKLAEKRAPYETVFLAKTPEGYVHNHIRCVAGAPRP